MRIILTEKEADAFEMLVSEIDPTRASKVWKVPDRYKNIVQINDSYSNEGLVVIDVDKDVCVSITNEISSFAIGTIPLIKSIIGLYESASNRIRSIIRKHNNDDSDAE